MTAQLNIPKLRFPGFEGEWEVQKMESYFELISGQHLGPLEYTSKKISEGLPYFTGPSDFTNYYESVSKWTVNKGKIAKKGDVLITVKGSGVGTYFLLKEIKEVVIGRQLMSLRSKDPDTAEFVSHILISKLNWFQGLASGNMIPGLARNDINTTELTFPSLPEQTKIASFLSKIDKKLTQLKKKKELLEQYKKGMMQKIFSQEVRFKDEKGEEFPEWEEKFGNEVFENVSNKNHNSDLPILAITQEHGAIPRDLIDFNISVTEKSVETYKVVERGDFIISLRSFQGGIEYSEYRGICSPAYIILRAFVAINKSFYKYYLKTPTYITELNRNLEGIRDGKMISYKYFSEISLPYPSLPEQTKIANFLSAIDKKINHTQTQIDKAEQWKKGLLQQMFV